MRSGCKDLYSSSRNFFADAAPTLSPAWPTMDRSSFFEGRGALALALAGVLFAVYRIRAALQWRARTRGTPLPPGPKPLPIVGNLFDVKLTASGYRDMAAQYGMYVQLNLRIVH